MDKNLERLEQIQKEMQEQMQAQMQEQLVKIQQDMMEKMMESQRNMMTQMTQMTQLLNGLMDKRKSPMVNVEENTKYPQYPPSFTPPHVQTRPEVTLQRPSVTIRPQQYQAGASMNLQTSSGSGDNPIITNVPDLDEIVEGERTKVELPKQLEDICKWLEEKFKAIESADSCYGMDAKDLSLVPDLVLPYKFKMPEFEKYNGTSCPEAHITMFCRRMMCRARIGSWRDLAQAFMKQYSHVTDMNPDRITLQNMEKKVNESFRQYAQRWREVAIQVQQPLLEKETTMLFINTLKAPFITHMLGSATKSFSDIMMMKEMIENTIKSGKIEAGESNKRMATRKRENEVNNTSMGYSKSITVSGGRKVKYEVAEVKTPLRQVWKKMVERGLIILDSEERFEGRRNHCEFHNREGHGIQECTEFRAIVQNLMDNKEMEFYEEIEGSEGREVYASDEGSMEWVQKGNHPIVIISKPRVNEVGTQVAPRVIIQKPAVFSYRDSKRVHCNYNYSVTIQGKENSTSASEEDQDTGFHTCSGRRYDSVNTRPESAKGKDPMVEQKKEKSGEPESPVNEPVKEEEAKDSDVHRNALMKVLNKTYVANDISVNKLDRLIGNINADNFIYFNDDEIPPGGRLPVDSSHMKECQNIVKAFDGTERRVMWRIEISLLIGPTTYEVDFLVMDIKPSYNYLLGRPWIHSAGVVPSSLHQKLKLVSEGRLVTINAEEDIIAAVTSDAPYMETNDEAVECSF
ncbi:hypothetical protein EPI10_016185 [Gossypium australe]|uniref:Retrotransposon gag domain-containing protein n=1 Tax=Gossypium australe TaxID=47621 RepID=A0A5B6VN13_9ROSI|nr:hypothetical protein EPI10_016185 [Gossypium australe]